MHACTPGPEGMEAGLSGPALFNSAFEAPVFERVLIGSNPVNSLGLPIQRVALAFLQVPLPRKNHHLPAQVSWGRSNHIPSQREKALTHRCSAGFLHLGQGHGNAP